MTNNLSNSISSWLFSYQQVLAQQAVRPEGSVISVSDAAGKLAFIYEKLRNTVDYRDEHLLRKHATARMIKRMAAPGSRGSQIAQPLVEELIRARYLPNNKIPESSVLRVQHVINKYIIIYNSAVDKNYRSEERRVGKECRSRWSP